MKNKALCIIQGRMGSTRLPGKVLKKVRGVSLLEYLIRRLKLSRRIDKIVVATTTSAADGRIVALCRKLRIASFRGAEEDVLDRYYRCVLRYPQYQNIVRITADCPLNDPQVIDEVIRFFERNHYDYASNSIKQTFPNGMDVEIFTRKALIETAQKAHWASEREHVTPYLRNSRKFKKGNFSAPYDFSHIRLTVDNPEDFEVVKFVIEHSKPTDSYLQYISLLTRHPEVMYRNAHIVRNEGYLKSLKNDFIVKR